MSLYKLRLGLIQLLFTAVYYLAPDDDEGARIKNALDGWIPPWHCHYAAKGGFNVQLREDCTHPRTPGKDTGFMTDRNVFRTCDYCLERIPAELFSHHKRTCSKRHDPPRKRPAESPRKHPAETK